MSAEQKTHSSCRVFDTADRYRYISIYETMHREELDVKSNGDVIRR